MAYLILGLIMGAAGGFVKFIETQREINSLPKSNLLNILSTGLLCGGLITAFIPGCQAVRASKEAKHDLDSVNNVIISKQDSIKKISASVEVKQDSIKILSESLIQKQEALIKVGDQMLVTQQDVINYQKNLIYTQGKLGQAQEELYKYATGGNSYCKMQIVIINESNDLANLSFSVVGKHPLSWIQARIVDLDDPNINNPSLQDLTKNVINVGTVTPGFTFVSPYNIHLDKTKEIRFNIFITASNGYMIQLIRQKFINGKWALAEIGYRGVIDRKEIYFKVDPEYPFQDKKEIFK